MMERFMYGGKRCVKSKDLEKLEDRIKIRRENSRADLEQVKKFKEILENDPSELLELVKNIENQLISEQKRYEELDEDGVNAGTQEKEAFQKRYTDILRLVQIDNLLPDLLRLHDDIPSKDLLEHLKSHLIELRQLNFIEEEVLKKRTQLMKEYQNKITFYEKYVQVVDKIEEIETNTESSITAQSRKSQTKVNYNNILRVLRENLDVLRETPDFNCTRLKYMKEAAIETVSKAHDQVTQQKLIAENELKSKLNIQTPQNQNFQHRTDYEHTTSSSKAPAIHHPQMVTESRHGSSATIETSLKKSLRDENVREQVVDNTGDYHSSSRAVTSLRRHENAEAISEPPSSKNDNDDVPMETHNDSVRESIDRATDFTEYFATVLKTPKDPDEDFIKEVGRRVKEFEVKIDSFSGSHGGVDYFKIDQSLTLLRDSLENISNRDYRHLLEPKVKVLRHINNLQEWLDRKSS